VHSAAEWFVLRVTAATQAIVLPRRALSALLILALHIFEWDSTGNPVRSIFGDHDRRLAHLIDLIATLDASSGIAQRAGGAVSHRGENLLHPGTVWINKGFLAQAKDRRQVVCAQAGVRTDPAIVENRDLLTDIRVAPVRHAVRLFLAGEADAGMGAIAERLDGRAAAPAQGHLRARRDALSSRVLQVCGVGHQVGAIERGLDAAP